MSFNSGKAQRPAHYRQMSAGYAIKESDMYRYKVCPLWKCIYHGAKGGTGNGCDYILCQQNMGRVECRRGCPPGEGCTRYTTERPADFKEAGDTLEVTPKPTPQNPKNAWQKLPPKKEPLPEKTERIRVAINWTAVEAMYNEGANDYAIAAELHISRETIRQWRKNTGRESHGKTTVIENDARSIALYKQGKSDREIAEVIGKTKDAVAKWRRRKHLPPNAGNSGRPKKKEESNERV